MTFLENPRFPENIAYGMAGGPSFQTDVVIVNSGFESRNITWAEARCSYDAAHGLKSQADINTLIAFFRAMKGRGHGFRFKDWMDYTVAVTEGIILPVGAAPGSLFSFQLAKQYVQGSLSDIRPIQKPVNGTVQIYRNGTLIGTGGSPGQYRIDTATGLITYAPTRYLGLASISQANPAIVSTTTAHGLNNGDSVSFIGANGMNIQGISAVNGQFFTVTNATPTTFQLAELTNTLGVDAAATYGTIAVLFNSGDILNWSGEFDVPCRFDTDQMKTAVDAYNVYSWGQIPVIEIKVGA